MAENSNAAQELQEAIAGLNTYQARFHQTVRDETDQILHESTGFVQLQRPEKMYWRSEQPFQSVTVSSDQVLWHYDIDLEQVSRSKLTEDVSETPALILSGDPETLKQHFTVSKQAPGKNSFHLLPLSASSVFTSLRFSFDPEGQLHSMEIVDSLGQTTSINFTDILLNKPLDESLFIFQVPDGVDLIDNG